MNKLFKSIWFLPLISILSFLAAACSFFWAKISYRKEWMQCSGKIYLLDAKNFQCQYPELLYCAFWFFVIIGFAFFVWSSVHIYTTTKLSNVSEKSKFNYLRFIVFIKAAGISFVFLEFISIWFERNSEGLLNWQAFVWLVIIVPVFALVASLCGVYLVAKKAQAIWLLIPLIALAPIAYEIFLAMFVGH